MYLIMLVILLLSYLCYAIKSTLLYTNLGTDPYLGDV